jgi:putative FmdB family regulatory protein
MPTYDYVCDACGHKFELFQSITAEVEKKCPECGKKKLRRLIGAGAAIVFKGSGFYQTDYRSDSYKKRAEADSKSSSESKSSEGKSSEGKSETKSSDAKSSESKSSGDSSSSKPEKKTKRKSD